MAETVRKYSLAALRHRLFRISLVFTLALVMGMGIFVFTTSSTNASTYQTQTGGAVNWTAAGVWSCTGGAPGSTICGSYPGDSTSAGDIARIVSASPLVNTPLVSAVALDMSLASGQVVHVQAPGVLPLTGSSFVTTTGTIGTNQLAIEGGTLVNTGTLQIGGGAGSSPFNFPGGTFSGAGVTNIISNGSFNVSSTIGPAPTISQQVINAGNTGSLGFATLTMSNGGTINNTGTFNVTSTATIAAGAGSGLLTNSGNLNVNSPFTVNVPFTNTGTVSQPFSLVAANFNGGSGPGGHSNATWNLSGLTTTLGLGGTHLFTNAESFPAGLGTINITGPTTFNTSTPAITIGSGNSVTNTAGGSLEFGTTATHTMGIAGGNYSQSGASTLKVKLANALASDQINVNGSATIGGSLVASLLSPYTGVNGDTFTVVTTTGGVIGTFAYTPLPYANGRFQIQYNPTNVQLIAVPDADISVAKSGPLSVPNGQNASYLITVTNNGPSAATGISISDTFTPNATFVSATPSTGSCIGTGPVTCTFPGLANGNSATVSLVLTANGTGTITNTATLASTTPTDPNPLNDSSSANTTITPAADLSIGVSGPASANAGAPVAFTSTVSNAGPDAAAAPVVTFSLSSGTITGVTVAGYACSAMPATTVTCTAAGPLAALGSTGFTIATTAPNQPGTMTLTGSVTSTTFDPTTPNTASANVAIAAVSDVSITKSVTTSPVVAGQNVVFSIVVSNAGPSDATGVVVTDTPGAGLTFVSNSGACTTAFPCNLATIPSASSVTITSTWFLSPSATGTLGNSASASAPGDPNSANNTAGSSPAAITTSADLSIVKSLTSTIVAGSNATYSIAVTNNGPSDALLVSVSDPTPAGMTFVSNSGACTTAFPCNLGTVAAGASVTINSTYAVSPTATGTISNTATVGSSSTPDPSAANNSSTATGTVGTNSDVGVVKTAGGTATPGSPITFTVDVKNFGPSDATGVFVTDTPGAGLTFVSNSGGCTTAYPCNLGTLTPGQIVTITSVYQVAPTATGSVTNTASVTSTSSDPIPANNSATASAPVVAANADLSITKTGPSALPASGSVTFTITVKNIGPAPAFNVMVNDSASRLVFVSNSGACSTPFPCSLGNLAAGATASISSTFTVTPGAQFASNSASVSSSSPDPSSANNSSTVTLGQSCPNVAPAIISPFSGQADVPLTGTITWSSAGAPSYEVYLGKAGTGCTTLVSTVGGTSFAYSGLDPNTDYEVRVVAIRSTCPPIASQCVRFKTGRGACNLAAPVLLSPKDGTKVTSPLKLQWGSVPGAESYHVVVAVDGKKTVDTTTTSTSLDVTVDNGAVTWSVTAIAGNCTSPQSNGTFNICSTPATPVAGVVGAPSAGRTYQVVVFNPSPTSVHTFEEADNDSFQNARSQSTSSPFVPYAHPASQTAQVFFYRVRALNECGLSGYSKVLRVVILPAVLSTRPVLNVPAGTRDEQILQIFIPGESERVAFTATTDRPWITRIDPSSGILPTEGITLNLHIDPTQLPPNGTFMASIVITTSPLMSGRITPHAGGTKTAPVTINLITPVVPVDSSSVSEDSLVIPAVGHLIGLNSQWQSDVRIFNPSATKMKYVLNFLALGSSDVKQTTIETDAGATTALDDIIHNWYGVGAVGDSATGVLQVVPVKDSGSQSALASIVASRTYSLAGEGTLGEFIAGVPLKQFAGSGSRMSLQQIAQTSSFRTNFGLVEATGKPASLLLTMFNSAGTKLFDLPVNLAANEQKLLNGLLTQQGVSSLTDGRMEVQVTGGDGKITAYASVIDNSSQNPLFVPGQTLGKDSAQLYVVPGVADLNNGAANWRSDMRIFNASSSAQSAELVFYPAGAGAQPFFSTVNINSGEVKVLDNLLQSTFGTSNNGGAVHVNTTNASQLVVTARTYNQTAAGTLGQFVPGSTLADAIGKSGSSLNILQVEDSMRFRTNVGLAEMTGKPATVEISVVLPDSKVTPTIEVPLAGNEFRQFGLSAFGLGNVYNARVSVHVVGGDGAVTAYGSVIDQVTSAPTYVAAK